MPLMLLINSPEIREKKTLLLLQKKIEIKVYVPPTKFLSLLPRKLLRLLPTKFLRLLLMT